MPKNIVICCDGTWNRFGITNTNVGKLCTTLVRSGQQIVYYDPGVGTIGSPGALTRIRARLSRLLDGAIATSLGQNVIEAYDFLARRYEPGDRIYLFGFSRGAYTVRAMAGMLHMYGLTERGNEQLTPHIWALYNLRGPDRNSPQSRERFKVADAFKSTFGARVGIHFLGVWDTVSSVGWVWFPLTLPFTYRNPSIAHARHAVAIDERRAFFRQNLLGRDPDDQDVKEVWFAGAHADVGGGYPDAESGLSQIALEWMMDEAAEQGLLIDAQRRATALGGSPPSVPPSFTQPIHNSLTGFWVLCEFVPRFRWRSDGRRVWGCNFFRPRIVSPDAVLHPTVLEKLQAGDYNPENVPQGLRAIGE